MMNNNEIKKHTYKIEIGDKIIVYRQDFNSNTYYKTMVQKRNYDGTKTNFYKELRFKKDVALQSGTKIIIKDMFEDVRENKADKYNAIWSLFILDFEVVEDEQRTKSQALEEYNNKVQLSDEDLPF